MKLRRTRTSAKKKECSRPNKRKRKKRSANGSNFVRLELVKRKKLMPNRDALKKKKGLKRKELVRRERLIELLLELQRLVFSSRPRKLLPRTRSQRPRV